MAINKQQYTDLQTFLNTLFEPDDLLVVAAIESWTNTAGTKQTRQRMRQWLMPGEILAKADQLDELNGGTNPANLYIGVCPRPASGSDKAEQVEIVRAVWADLDDCPVADARQRLTASHLPRPTALIDSGHGCHLYWRLAKPALAQQPGTRDQARSVLRAIEQSLGGDHTNDLARLLRLPGFRNVKNARNGQAATSCSLVEHDATRRYALADFAALPQNAGPSLVAAKPTTTDAAIGTPPVPACDVVAVNTVLGRLDTSTKDRSLVDYAVCRDLAKLGLEAEAVWMLVQAKSKFAERGRGYFDKTWANVIAGMELPTAAAPSGPGGTPPAGPQGTSSSSVLPETIEVLGTDAEGGVLIWSKDTRRLHRVLKLREIDRAMLIQIAGRQACEAVVFAMDKEDRKIAYNIMRDAIADASRNRWFGADEFIGQGVWRVRGHQGLILVSGNESRCLQINAGGIQVTEITVPVIGTTLLELDGAKAWMDVDQFVTDLTAMIDVRRKEIWEELRGYLGCWSFTGPYDQSIVAALILATNIQAVLSFRPQVWTTGPSNCGKTALKTLQRGIWPYAVDCENETSEAAIRQEISHNALPLLLDEQESWHGRRSVIKLLRSSTRGGSIVKGTPGGRAMRFQMHHMAWLSSVDVDLRREADRNRFVIVELDRLTKQIVIPPDKVLRKLGAEAVAASVSVADTVIRIFDELTCLPSVRQYGRQAEAYALPVAIQAAFTCMTVAAAEQLLSEVMADKQGVAAQQHETDDEDLLNTLMTSRLQGFDDVTLGDALRDKKYDKDLAAAGVRWLPTDRVFLAGKIIQREFLKGTQWEQANVSDILARMPGATRQKHRVGNRNVRGVVLPLDLVVPHAPKPVFAVADSTTGAPNGPTPTPRVGAAAPASATAGPMTPVIHSMVAGSGKDQGDGSPAAPVAQATAGNNPLLDEKGAELEKLMNFLNEKDDEADVSRSVI